MSRSEFAANQVLASSTGAVSSSSWMRPAPVRKAAPAGLDVDVIVAMLAGAFAVAAFAVMVLGA